LRDFKDFLEKRRQGVHDLPEKTRISQSRKVRVTPLGQDGVFNSPVWAHTVTSIRPLAGRTKFFAGSPREFPGLSKPNQMAVV
jgi:hypothetical protein